MQTPEFRSFTQKRIYTPPRLPPFINICVYVFVCVRVSVEVCVYVFVSAPQQKRLTLNQITKNIEYRWLNMKKITEKACFAFISYCR